MADVAAKSIQYRTTRPRIPLTADRPILTASVNAELTIQLRPFAQSDLEYVHRLRTQEVVMVNTSTGKIDESVEKSQQWMNRFLAPNDAGTLDLMLWAKLTDQPWEHIGCLGVHIMKPVPHIGYMLRSEWWGKSIATKAVKLFLDMWWSLERYELTLTEADAEDEHELHIIKLEAKQEVSSKDHDGVVTVPEVIVAEIEENNRGSLRVIEKLGFHYKDRESVVEANGTFVLLDYTLSRAL